VSASPSTWCASRRSRPTVKGFTTAFPGELSRRYRKYLFVKGSSKEHKQTAGLWLGQGLFDLSLFTILESDQKDIEATVSRDEAIELATEWAASFHEDESLEVTDIEFRIDPLRFWLVMFKKVGTDEAFYSMVLPDRTIVEPEDEMKVWVFSNGRFIRRV
jgi:hypothetical protein